MWYGIAAVGGIAAGVILDELFSKKAITEVHAIVTSINNKLDAVLAAVKK
jgi:hypothetical protein